MPDYSVNGKKIGASSITTVLPVSGLMVGLTEVTQDDEIDSEAAYGMGGSPIGYGDGQRKGTLSFTAHEDDAIRIRDEMSTIGGGDFYNLPPLPITIVKSEGNLVDPTVVLVRLNKRSLSFKSGDKFVYRKFEGFILSLKEGAVKVI
jgi:hypothetical protein